MWERKPGKDKGPPPPQSARLFTHDTTMESVQNILANQERGIGLLRDELAGWIDTLEKYGKGDRPFFLQAFNADSYVVIA